MPDNILSTYPVDYERTAIAVGYSNPAYIADEVLPRVTVGRKEYRYTEYPIGESFTVPDTRIGRRSAPTMVHFTASEKPGACEDYGLEDANPGRRRAERAAGCGEPGRPLDHAAHGPLDDRPGEACGGPCVRQEGVP